MSDNPLADLHFDVLRNALYHSARRGFFESVNRWLNFVVVAAGAAAVVDIHKQFLGRADLLAAFTAVAGLFQLVFDLGGKARTHEFLQQRFYELLAEITENPNAGPEEIAGWKAALKRIYAEEPPPMNALDAIAFNAACSSLGKPREKRIHLNWWYSLWRHVYPFNGTEFKSDEERQVKTA